MPRQEPKDAEFVLVSPEDAELLDFLNLRRTFDKDGSILYVQLIGAPAVLDAAVHNQDLAAALLSSDGKKSSSFSLPRMIMSRMLGRPMTNSEVVLSRNGKNGDCRRHNLELSTRSEIASRPRSSWSSTGEKYVYLSSRDKFVAQRGGVSLGTYDTVDEAANAVAIYQTMLDKGVPEKEASARLLGRSRNMSRARIQE